MHVPAPPTRRSLSRRRLLGSLGLLTAGTAGCTENTSGGDTQETTPGRTGTDTTPEQTPDDQTPDGDTPSVAGLSVADYIHYALAGVHPHVHRKADTQYVVVRLDTTLDADTIRPNLTLELDGTEMSLADRRLIDWETETVDVAFAVPKGATSDSGRVLFAPDGGREDLTELSSLDESTLDRLNDPPVFTVSKPSVSVSEIQAGEQVEATVRFSLENSGTGKGTFGASLKGNYVSGSSTVTETLSPGAEQEVTATVTLVGDGDNATVRLDWGSDEWTTDVPVVAGDTSSTVTPTTGSAS